MDAGLRGVQYKMGKSFEIHLAGVEKNQSHVMPTEHIIVLSLLIGVVAFLYSSVGHAGASGYIAVLALFAVPPEVIKPVALLLNILVASLGTWQFVRAGHFSWGLFWPFALPAIPLAFLGGYISLPGQVFHVLVGIVLLFSALRFVVKPEDDAVRNRPGKLACLPLGGGLGLLAGLTGTGGGIFLTPLLLHLRWAKAKTAAAVSVVFILGNSTAGLLGNLAATRSFPAFAVIFLVAALCGGALGSYCGSQRFPPRMIKRLLAGVLLIAGLKLILA